MNFTSFPVLETPRLRLRQLESTDDEAIFFLYSDERVLQYIERPRQQHIDEARALITKLNNGIAENESIYWVITYKDAPGLIGTVCLWNIDKEIAKAETGYMMHPAFQGKGIMYEALTEVTVYGFQQMQLRRIEAYTHRNNKHSINLLEKLHFSRQTDMLSEPGNNDIIFTLTNPKQ